MGQAIADLPDPLETPQASTLGADDLLAQMAGEEIDRLLAEADAEFPALRSEPEVTEAASPPPEQQRKAAAGVPFPSTETSAPPAMSEADALAGELDSLLSSLATAPPHAPAKSDAVAGVVDSGDSAPANLPAEADISSVESAALRSTAAQEALAAGSTTPPTAEETSAAERSALSLEALPIESATPADAPTATELAASTALIEPPARLPRLLLLPLEWLNAPLAACPDLLREFIGKAAILTVLNALALILYVRFIRRH
jgi:hypothetical protein